MYSRNSRHALVAALLLLPFAFAQTAKRPLTHKNYDAWRSIATQRLSPDGKFLAYAVFPQEGDGEVVVRNLVTGKEAREPAGQRPQPAPPTPGTTPEEGAPQQANVTMTFAEDSRTVVFSVFPAKAVVEKALKERKHDNEMPKNGMVIMDLGSFKAARIERVKSFRMPLKAAGYLAWLREPVETKTSPEQKEPEKKESTADQRRGTPASGSSSSRRPEFGSEMVLRTLATAADRTFADVVEYSFSDDGQALLYTVSGKDPANNGVYAARPGDSAAPAALLSGKGKYSRITWDEKQSRVAFVSDRDGSKWKLYLWDRGSASALEAASAAAPGFRSEFAVSDKGAIAFSKDGSRVFFAVALPASARSEAAQQSEDRPVLDLWHWKDDYIQPMQKSRADRDRNRTFAAAWLIAGKKVVQLGDAALADVQIGENAQWLVGADDRDYRRMVEYDERHADAWAVDSDTGERRLLVKKHRGGISLGPGGRYGVWFDGKDWHSVAVPSGNDVNLTAGLGVSFHNEEHDTPGTPQSHGMAGWTRDGSVILNDRFDIWVIAPDGSGAKCLTAGAGRKQGLQFRHVRFANEEDPRDRWIDPSKPVLLRAEHLKTRETGFWRTGFSSAAPPRKLLMTAANVGTPIKAKNAETYAFSRQSFRHCPDLYVSDSTFKEPRKVSDTNPQQSQFVWGTAEHVPFKNMDGVPLTAILYKPENFEPHKKYPLLVYIYERLSQNIHRYVEPRPGTSINITYYVSNGYLVLTPDIVYTVGFPGQSALKAVLPAVQAVVDKGIVDENAIGIQGHSWGGYQIAYMITQTGRFRAVAAGAPVANMISAYDGIRWGPGLPRQFQYERTQSRIGGSIWQYPTRFIENSPIFWADRVKTPVMMLHNDADDAVPWYQGIEFYLALRRLGKEVYLFNYNGEPHGLRKRPNQKDYTARMQQYFDHYLKGAAAPDWMVKGVPYLERDRALAGENK